MPTGIYKHNLLSEQHKRNISLGSMGRVVSSETRRKIGLANSISHKGLKQSEETKKKRSLLMKKIWKTSEFRDKNKGNLGNIGEKSGTWKGDRAKYKALHKWLRIHKPKPKFCERCHKEERLHLANIKNHIYTRKFEDYKWFCMKCHRDFDAQPRDIYTGKFICKVGVKKDG